MAEDHPRIPAAHADLELLTPKEVAALVKRSTITLERWRRLKKGPPFIRMSGTRVGYPVAGLQRWIASTNQPS